MRRNSLPDTPARDTPVQQKVRDSLDAIAERLIADHQRTPVIGILAVHMAQILRESRWPGADTARRSRLQKCARELAKIGGTPTNDEAREIIIAAATLLCKHGLLDSVPEIAFPENDPRSHRSVAELGRVPDPTGTRTLAQAQRDSVVALMAVPVDLVALARGIAINLCLSFAASDTIDALAAARWDDIDWERAHLALPKPIIRHGAVIAVSARFVVLSPLVLLALAVLRAQQGGASIFSPASLTWQGDATSWITAVVKQYGLTSRQMRPVASQLARQHLPGWVVDAAIDDAEPYCPLVDNEALESLLSARFSADIPLENRSIDAPTPRTTSTKRLPSPVRESLSRFNKHLPKKGRGRSKRARADAGKLIRREAAALLAHVLPIEPTATTPSLYKALRSLFRQIDESTAADTGQQEPLIANTACTLLHLAYRLERPPGDEWLERGTREGDRSSLSEVRSLVALGTIRSLKGTLTTSLHAIGEIPLTQWADTEWLTIDYSTQELSTLRLRIIALRQLADFARTKIGLQLRPGWPAIPNETVNAKIALPRPGQIVGVFEALARIPEGGEHALLLVSAMLGFGLREQEAAQLFASEIDGLSCHVAADAAKDGENRRAPQGWLPKIGVEALEQRQRTALQEAKTATMEPWLLTDIGRYNATIALVRRVLAEWGMHPHLLRHCHITWRQLAKRAHDENPGYIWPKWVIAAAREKDGLRAAAQGAGHSTSRETRAVYTQLHLWLVERVWQHRDMKILDTLVSKKRLGDALKLSSAQWDRALGTSQPPTAGPLASRITLSEAVMALRTLLGAQTRN